MALGEAVKEIKWLRQLLDNIKVKQLRPTLLMSDNQGAICLSKNAEHHRRTKHIDVRYHLIRTEQEDGTVTVEYTPTDKQPADMLTKALSGPGHT